jgi:hypothetical protein
MAKATLENTPISSLFQSAYLRAVFAAAERDNPDTALVPSRRPEPVLRGSDAIRVLEVA